MPDARVVLEGLRIQAGERALVDGVGFHLEAGEILALVGASGSGKTLTARSLLGLPGPHPGVVAARLEVVADGRVHRPYAALAGAGHPARRARAVEEAFQAIRGAVVGLLPQDARGGLDPLRTVGRQVADVARLAASPVPAAEWLRRAGFRAPEEVLALHAHQLSGGMAQRAAIALALARGSRFLVADEPTTGLDPTVQQEILEEVARTAAAGVGVLLITHDLRIVPRLARRVVVMHGGRMVETLPAGRLREARSPEGRALLEATARVAGGAL